MTRKSILKPLGALTSLLILASGAQAQQGWDPNGTASVGGNGIWDTSSLNWTPLGTQTQTSALVTYTPGNTVLFCAGPSGSASQGNFFVTNNTANLLTGSIVNGLDNPGPCTVTINGTGSLTTTNLIYLITYHSGVGYTYIDVPITGTGPVESQSSGSLYLNSSNTFTSGFLIDGTGGVGFGNNSAFGTGPISWLVQGFIQPTDTAAYNITNAMFHTNGIETFAGNSGGVTFSGPWTLPATGLTVLTNISASPITIAGPISGTANLALNAPAASGWILTGTNTYTGNTYITNGTLTISGAGVLGGGNYAGQITNVVGLVYKSSAAQTLSGNITGAGNLIQNGPGQLTLAAVDPYTGNTSIASNSVLVIGGSGSLGGTYAKNITNNGTLLWNSTSGSTLAGIISGAGGITQSGTSSITLGNSANTFTGPLIVNNGTVAIDYDGSLGAVPASYVSNAISLSGGTNAALRAAANGINLNARRGIYLGTNGGQIQVASGDTLVIGGVLNGPGSFQSGANISTGLGVTVLSNVNTYGGSTTIACGTLRLATNGALPSGTPLTIAACNASVGSVLDLNGFSQTIGTLASSPGIGGIGTGFPAIFLTGALTIKPTNSSTFSGVISSNGGSLTFIGNVTNTLTLAYTNTYTGPTIIASGTLALGANGSISNSVSISIAAGAMLDVSAIPAFSLTKSNSLIAGGAANPAIINCQPLGTVSLGSQPITLDYDGTNLVLSILQGTLVLNSNAFTINGPVLPVGSYTLISQATGSVAATGPFAVSGSAIGAGVTAAMVATNGNVNLVISSNVVSGPVSITGAGTQPDGSFLLNFSGTPGVSYIIQAATNLTAPVTWFSLSTNLAGTNGLFQFDDPGYTNYPARYYQAIVGH